MSKQIQRTIVTEQDVTILKARGRITSKDILQAFDDFYAYSPTNKLLWDFSDADLSAVSSSDLKTIVTHTKQYSHLRPDGKTAFYGSGELSYGLSRQYSTLAELENHSIRFASFRAYDEAMEWLLIDE